jgi:hypothetical protein
MDSLDIPPTPVSNVEFILADDVANDQNNGASLAAQDHDASGLYLGLDSFPVKCSSFPRKICGKIGDFCDKNISLIFCARKLTALFLLPDEKGDLIPDSCVRVSLKVLAMDCLANVITLLPKIFLLTLYSDQVS